jgi:hypothetical protein
MQKSKYSNKSFMTKRVSFNISKYCIVVKSTLEIVWVLPDLIYTDRSTKEITKY